MTHQEHSFVDEVDPLYAVDILGQLFTFVSILQFLIMKLES